MEWIVDIQIFSSCLDYDRQFRSTDKVWRYLEGGIIITLCLRCHLA